MNQQVYFNIQQATQHYNHYVCAKCGTIKFAEIREFRDVVYIACKTCQSPVISESALERMCENFEGYKLSSKSLPKPNVLVDLIDISGRLLVGYYDDDSEFSDEGYWVELEAPGREEALFPYQYPIAWRYRETDIKHATLMGIVCPNCQSLDVAQLGTVDSDKSIKYACRACKKRF